MGIKKKHTNEFKAKVVMVAMREDRTLSELATAFGVHPITIRPWKKKVIQGLPPLFEGGGLSNGKEKEQQILIATLYGKIGEIEVGKAPVVRILFAHRQALYRKNDLSGCPRIYDHRVRRGFGRPKNYW